METTANAQRVTVKRAAKVSGDRATAGWKTGESVPFPFNPPARVGWTGSGFLLPVWEQSEMVILGDEGIHSVSGIWGRNRAEGRFQPAQW